MKPLIDGDILLYETGFAVQAGWDTSEHVAPPFDWAQESIDARIGNICAMVGATEPPTIFLTGKTNFRYDIAKTTPYKARPSNKPFHYYNLKAYVQNVYDCITTVGMEADDALAITATARPSDVIICSRDKDLRAIPGWSYGWENHLQPQFGPEIIDPVGRIQLSDDRKRLTGTGGMWFYAQCILGDGVDSIPGLGRGTGPVLCWDVLGGCTTLAEAFRATRQAYRNRYGDKEGDERLLEMGRLLHMTRYLDEWGNPILWEFPYED